jgi:hypothetical protein
MQEKEECTKLGWQEMEVGAKIENLSPKTKVQEYCKLQFDELLAVLKKNKRKLAIDPARRESQERLRLEFDASVGKLLPLMEHIKMECAIDFCFTASSLKAKNRLAARAEGGLMLSPPEIQSDLEGFQVHLSIGK